ncbi:hypothetical protein AB7179_08610 [Providencia manganoxydans]|uniref:hypothetical protein n=1 Tax=Providencia manganoxydans TaxID=2923283 RepID=UPI0034E5CF2B
MKNPKLITKPFAQNGQKNAIPENYSSSMESNQATWDTGFGQITMIPVAAGGLPPKGQDFNGIFNQISENVVYLSKGGRFKFSADYAAAINGYPKGAILQSDDETKEYQSLVDNNKVNFNTANPSLVDAAWTLISTNDILQQLADSLAKKVDIAPQLLNGSKPIAEQLFGGLGCRIRASTPYPSDAPIQGAIKIVQIGSDEWPTLLAFDAYNRKMWLTTRKTSGGAFDEWLDITDFVTPGEMSLALLKKFDKENVSQQLGNDVNKVPSLDLFAKELGKKLSSVPDATTGTKGIVKISNRAGDNTSDTVPSSLVTYYLYEELGKKLSSVPDATTSTKGLVKLSNRIADAGADTVPTSALAAYLNENKINISDIANDVGSSTTKVLSQKATTDRLLGINQTWKDVTSSRGQGTNYTNSSSKAIQVVITAAQSSAQVAVNLKLSITGVGSFQSSSFGSNADACVTCIIPPSASYSVSASGGSGISITKWLELS